MNHRLLSEQDLKKRVRAATVRDTAGETRVVRISDVLDWKQNHYKPEHGQRKEPLRKKGKSK